MLSGPQFRSDEKNHTGWIVQACRRNVDGVIAILLHAQWRAAMTAEEPLNGRRRAKNVGAFALPPEVGERHFNKRSAPVAKGFLAHAAVSGFGDAPFTSESIAFSAALTASSCQQVFAFDVPH